MENWKFEEIENEIVVRIPKEKNYTLDDLRQKLINKFYNQDSYEECEIEILKLLFDSENNVTKKLKEFTKATNYNYR